MSAPRRRATRGLATTTVAASLLVGTAAAAAQAAAYPTVTVAQAKKTVPAAKLLPGSVKLSEPVSVSHKATAIPCLTKPKVVTLLGDSAEGDYRGKATSVLSPKYLEWTVTIITFPSAAKATAAANSLLVAEKSCPETSTTTIKGTTEAWRRSLGTKYTVGTFKGYRSVENLLVSTDTASVAIRAFETFLVRGNVMISLEEVAGATPANAKEQDAWRKTVTKLLVARVSAIK